MDGGCKKQIENKSEITEKDTEEAKSLLATKLSNLTTKTIARNMLSEQQFQFRIESGIEAAYLWNDEITQAIAMSCVPAEILET